MKKTTKQMLSLFSAVSLAVAMAVPAFAQGDPLVQGDSPCYDEEELLYAQDNRLFFEDVMEIWEEPQEYEAGTALESGSCGENAVYTLWDDGILEIKTAGSGFGIIRTNPWKANHQNDVTEVLIQEGIQEIGWSVFDGCTNLTSVILPDSLQVIGRFAFMRCGLAEIVIPSNVKVIEYWAFSNCSNLSQVLFAGNAPVIYVNAFRYDKLKAIVPSGDATWTEDVRMQYGADITWLNAAGTDITPALKTSGACGDNASWSISGSTLTISGAGAVISYNMANIAPWMDSFQNVDTLIIENGITNVPQRGFDSFRLTSVSLPESVTRLEQECLIMCNQLEEIEIPAGVTEIGANAFTDCRKLQKINLPEGLTAIHPYSFAGCKLETVEIPAKVNMLGNMAFANNSALTEIRFAGHAPSISDTSFQNVTATVYYPGNDASWTGVAQKNYGGNLTWVAVGGAPVPEEEPENVMYRLYNPFTEEHLLTGSASEKNQLVAAGWHLDGVAWNVPEGGQSVYRLYNPFDDWHIYSVSQEEIAHLKTLGWVVDGVVSSSASPEVGKPIYRLFNPYVQKNYHMLTASAEERDFLISVGWVFEGVAWYSV